MNFAEAMKEVLDGKSVRASNWIDEAYINTDRLIPVTQYSLGELLALNWELYGEPIPTEEFTRNYEQLLRETLAEALINMADHLMRKGE